MGRKDETSKPLSGIILLVSSLFLFNTACEKRSIIKHNPDLINPGNVIYAGVRSSSYGLKPFPEPSGWKNALQVMSGYFKGSIPCAIWIVGEFRRNRACHLYFPSDENEYNNIEFETFDKHERYLSYFDQAEIKVFLQVEPASAEVMTLIDLVLRRYRHHRCVVGLGVDVEWHRESENPGWGIPVTDSMAKAWEERVKSYNAGYRLFLKHWNRNWMPPSYRGDIIFVDDSQMLDDLDSMLEEFVEYWASHFYPNTVFFQIGYRSDKPWWGKLENPPVDIGMAIARQIKQECGIFWIDFTLRDLIPSL